MPGGGEEEDEESEEARGPSAANIPVGPTLEEREERALTQNFNSVNMMWQALGDSEPPDT